jgi:hypothetical protein
MSEIFNNFASVSEYVFRDEDFIYVNSDFNEEKEKLEKKSLEELQKEETKEGLCLEESNDYLANTASCVNESEMGTLQAENPDYYNNSSSLSPNCEFCSCPQCSLTFQNSARFVEYTNSPNWNIQENTYSSSTAPDSQVITSFSVVDLAPRRRRPAQRATTRKPKEQSLASLRRNLPKSFLKNLITFVRKLIKADDPSKFGFSLEELEQVYEYLMTLNPQVKKSKGAKHGAILKDLFEQLPLNPHLFKITQEFLKKEVPSMKKGIFNSRVRNKSVYLGAYEEYLHKVETIGKRIRIIRDN